MNAILLTDAQYNCVKERFDREGLSYQPLKEELLDHLCCAIEAKLQGRLSFEKAMEEAFSEFERKEFQKIQKQTIFLLNYKKQIMKVITLTVVALLAYLPIFNLPQDAPPSFHPLGESFKITATFGTCFHPVTKAKRMHKGIDFKAPMGTPVKAGGAGIVKAVNYHKDGYGTHIIIEHTDGYETMYAHLSEALVKKGTEVEPGQMIGKVGTTGASTGPHLHYEVRKDGEPTDPMAYLAQ
jgi:murein DD-endopeptidase MepM/ murein hydrolase activator NlpD